MSVPALPEILSEVSNGLVLIYSPTCGHCVEFMKEGGEWEGILAEFPQLNSTTIEVGRNEEVDEMVMRELNVEGTPTIFLVVNRAIIEPAVTPPFDTVLKSRIINDFRDVEKDGDGEIDEATKEFAAAASEYASASAPSPPSASASSPSPSPPSASLSKALGVSSAAAKELGFGSSPPQEELDELSAKEVAERISEDDAERMAEELGIKPPHMHTTTTEQPIYELSAPSKMIDQAGAGEHRKKHDDRRGKKFTVIVPPSSRAQVLTVYFSLHDA